MFGLETHLEDFLIENWDKTDLAQRQQLELITEDGELVSQQYRSKIGVIDILCRDKITKQYVVIELKRGQTSDDTIGQIARYMAWIEENKSGGEPSRGIIIAAANDQKLMYALLKLKDVQLYLYEVNFTLNIAFPKEPS